MPPLLFFNGVSSGLWQLLLRARRYSDEKTNFFQYKEKISLISPICS